MAKNSNAERLKIELEIAKAIENSTKDIKTFRDAQKTLKENSKLMAIAQAEVNELIKKAKDETRELTKEEEKLISARNLEIQQLKQINTELSSTKNALRAIGNQLVKNGKELLPTLGSIKSAILDVDDKLRSSAAQIGLSGQAFKTFKGVAEDSRDTFTSLGFSLTANLELMSAFADETGRQNLMSVEAANSLAVTAKILGMSTEAVGQLAGQMEAFGLGALDSSQTMLDIRDTAEGMGVNTGKVMKKFQQNLGLLNKLDFKGGMKGMAKMAAYSEKYKISMEAVAGVADKVFRPEGAIEAAANLQMLGGSLSQLGDPFQLMYQARYAPEELAKSLTKAAKQSAVFNEATGEFEVNALELDRLKEAAQALGMDYTELVQTAKQSAKIDFMSKFLPSSMSPEDKELLTGMADMKGGKAVITMPDRTVKALSDLTDGDRKLLLEKAKNRKELEEQSMSLKDEWNSIQNTMLSVGVSIFQPLADWLNGEEGKKWINGFVEGIKSFGKFVKSAIEFLGPTKTFGVMTAIFLGRMGLLGPLIKSIGTFGSWVGKLIPALGSWVKNGVSKLIPSLGGGGGTPGAGAGGGGGGGMNAAQTLASGKASKAAGIGSFMKSLGSATQIIAISGALFIFAKALQEFNTVQWESLAKGGISLGILLGGMKLMEKINPANIMKGALGIALLGAALIPFSYAMSLLGDTGGGTMIGAAVALGIFGVSAALFGLLLPEILLGSVAILALSGAVAVFGLALGVAAPGFEMFIGAFSQLPELIGPMLLMGPALFGMSAGIFLLATSLVALGAAYLMGGFLGLFALGETAEHLKTAFGDIDAKGISESINAINNVDMKKIDALRDLSNSMAMWGLFGAKPIEVRMTVGGDIELSGEGGGRTATDWINDPTFVSNLKDLISQQMEKDKGGGGH